VKQRAGKNNSAIGVFDSGVGGLTVVKEIFRQMPRERVVYFGDTARYPYGNKARETLIRFGLENAAFLSGKRIKVLVVACNSSSAYCLPELRRALKVPVVGVIEPGAWAAWQRTKTGRVGIIGTSATVLSGSYQRALKHLEPSIKVFAQACPLFVHLVEEGWLNHSVTSQIARVYLGPLKKKRVDTLVLGCTHYPLIKKVIAQVMGPQVVLVDSARETARQVLAHLEDKRLLNNGRVKSMKDHRFFVSDTPEKFIKVCHRFLGKRLPPVKQDGPK
jgi:glutamate racemase